MTGPAVKEKMIAAHMRTAYNYAELSSARRLKVGAIVVRDDSVISIGYNGMPAGWDNNCEDEVLENYASLEGAVHRTVLKTRSEVLHAEMNALGKLAGSDRSARDADMFVTHAPCLDCAKLIHAARIRRVFYSDTYRSDAGIRFLEKCSIEVQQVK
jgi:dCMP deaminase